MMLHIKELEQHIEEKLWKHFFHHPLEGALFSIIVLPLGVLFAVVCCTTIFALPFGFLLGWI